MAPPPCPICASPFCPGPDVVSLDPNLCRVCHLLGATNGICSTCEAEEATGKATEIWKSQPVAQLQGERVAFREWQVGEDLGLYSTGVGERWEREMVADSSRCTLAEVTAWQSNQPTTRKIGGHERSPDPNCLGCGLHAFYEVPDSLRYARDDTGLLGAIVVSGRTMLGPTGVRAEKARVVLLAYANDRQKALADAASRKLGVGCCALEDLERLALEYGQPVPDDEKPEQEGFAGGGVILGGSIALAANAVVTGNNLVGGGSAAIKNLRLGIPNGQSVEVDGSSGEVAVRVDGQEWHPRRDFAKYRWVYVQSGCAAVNLALGIAGNWWSFVAAGFCGAIAGLTAWGART